MILGKNAIILDIEDAKKICSELERLGRDRASISEQLGRGTFDAIDGLRKAVKDIEDTAYYAEEDY